MYSTPFFRPFAPLYGWVPGYKTNGGGEAVATLVYFQKVEDGAAEAASAMVMRTAERTNGLRCCLVSEALRRRLLLRGGEEAATVERGMRRKREDGCWIQWRRRHSQ